MHAAENQATECCDPKVDYYPAAMLLTKSTMRHLNVATH